MKMKIILIAILGILLFSACNPEGKLPQPDIEDILPKVSPDGKKIVFTRIYSTSTKPGMYVMDIDGKNLKNIYSYDNNDNIFPLISASWSPNSQNLVFIRQDKTLVIVNVSGEVLQSVKMEFTDYFSSIPYWSKDGKFILCTHFDVNNTLPIVSLITGDLQNQRTIQLSNPEHKLQGIISLSNNNDELLYANQFNIFIADTSGKVKKSYDLNVFRSWFSSPEWDNTQASIMYMNNNLLINIFNVNDLKEKTILEKAFYPSFTPDGKSVIFTRSDNLGVHRKIWMKNLITNEEYPINY